MCRVRDAEGEGEGQWQGQGQRLTGSRSALTTSPVGMSQNSRMASWSCARYSPIASSPRMRSAGVEAFEPNQPAQPMYAVYNATGTATRERQPDE